MLIKSLFNKLLKKIYILPLKILPGYWGKRVSIDLSEKLIVVDILKTKYGLLKYYCSSQTTLWRSRTLFSKEPETINWIDKMNSDDCLWDIGSNVGLYSMYAGKKGLSVLAFEPSALNTFLISKNIEINNLKDNVVLYPIAISNETSFGYLNMTNTDIGGALNEFNNEDLIYVTDNNLERKVVFKQGMVAYSIDTLIDTFNLKTPNYIKVDVDSIEDKILYGADKTLLDERVKGILVELDEDASTTFELISYLEKKGFVLYEKKQSDRYSNTVFANLYNFIFIRKTNEDR